MLFPIPNSLHKGLKIIVRPKFFYFIFFISLLTFLFLFFIFYLFFFIFLSIFLLNWYLLYLLYISFQLTCSALTLLFAHQTYPFLQLFFGFLLYYEHFTFEVCLAIHLEQKHFLQPSLLQFIKELAFFCATFALHPQK